MITNGYANPYDKPLTELLELLIEGNLNEITYLDLSGTYPDEKEALLLTKFISSENCKLKRLNLAHNNLAYGNAAIYCQIADAIGKNQTIVHLDLGSNVRQNLTPLYFIEPQTLNDFVERLAIAIKDHPCLETLNLGENCLRKSIYKFIDNLPKTVKHLDLSRNSGISSTEIAYIFRQTTKIQTINLSNMEPYIMFSNIEHIIRANTSIVDLKYFWYDSDQMTDKKWLIDNAIETMLANNRNALNKASKAAKQLILIKKFKK